MWIRDPADTTLTPGAPLLRRAPDLPWPGSIVCLSGMLLLQGISLRGSLGTSSKTNYRRKDVENGEEATGKWLSQRDLDIYNFFSVTVIPLLNPWALIRIRRSGLLTNLPVRDAI